MDARVTARIQVIPNARRFEAKLSIVNNNATKGMARDG